MLEVQRTDEAIVALKAESLVQTGIDDSIKIPGASKIDCVSSGLIWSIESAGKDVDRLCAEGGRHVEHRDLGSQR